MYYDLLARIKNAELAKIGTMLTPFSRMDFEIAKILAKAKYIRDVQKKSVHRKNFIEIKLSYIAGKPALQDFKIISKPSRRVYFGYRDLRPIKSGYGLAILSTPKGIMSNVDARKKKVGGEYLFQVW